MKNISLNILKAKKKKKKKKEELLVDWPTLRERKHISLKQIRK